MSNRPLQYTKAAYEPKPGRVNEVQLTGTFGRWTPEAGVWYKVLRRNPKSYTIFASGGIVTAFKTQVTAER